MSKYDIFFKNRENNDRIHAGLGNILNLLQNFTDISKGN